MRQKNLGQMRIVEAMIACIILIIGILSTVYFSSVFSVEQSGAVTEYGENVLQVLDNTDLVKNVVLNATNSISDLRLLLQTLIPTGIYYNLTFVSGLSNNLIANVTNMVGQDTSVSRDVVSFTRVITVSLPLARVSQTPLDIVLIIDRSGSMSQSILGDPYSKLTSAKRAAKSFVDQLNSTGDRVGLVSYSDTARTDSGLTNNFNLVKQKIDSLSANGYTNIGDGLAKMIAEFSAHARSGAILATVLLTDGVANRPCPHFPQHVETCPNAADYALSQSSIAAGSGILIYTIGLGSSRTDFNEDLLMAMQTNGYFYAPSASDLMGIYDSIVQDLLYQTKYEIVVLTLTLAKAQ